MGNFIANRSKGRFVELAERVNANDPANSAFVLDVLAASGVEADSVLLDKDTLADVVSGATNFATQASLRKTLADGALTVVYDDTNDRTDVDCADQTWTAVAAGDGWSDLVFGYDSDTTAGTDSGIVFVSQHDFPITPDGSDVTATISVFARAS